MENWFLSSKWMRWNSLNSEKYEIVYSTLMNRAMDPKIEVTDKKYFSVNEYGGEIPQFNYHASGAFKKSI